MPVTPKLHKIGESPAFRAFLGIERSDNL